MRILLVEDDPMIGESVSEWLQGDGYAVDWLQDGDSALLALHTTPFALVILDLGLPGRDGLEVLKEIRSKESHIPVLITTARDTVDDRIAGLDSGADDYLVKPFSFQELEARIKAILRRGREDSVQQLVCDDLVLNCNTRRARRKEVEIELTVKEYRLLEYFMTHQGMVLSRLTLLKDVWDKNFDTNTNVVDVYVNYLRGKIDKEHDKKLIHTVVGSGYIMYA